MNNKMKTTKLVKKVKGGEERRVDGLNPWGRRRKVEIEREREERARERERERKIYNKSAIEVSDKPRPPLTGVSVSIRKKKPISPNGKSPNGKSPKGRLPTGRSPKGRSPTGRSPIDVYQYPDNSRVSPDGKGNFIVKSLSGGKINYKKTTKKITKKIKNKK